DQRSKIEMSPPVVRVETHRLVKEGFGRTGPRHGNPSGTASNLLRSFRPVRKKNLGDNRCASALPKESPDVVAAVRGFIQPSMFAGCPHPKAVLGSAPKL